MHSLDFGVRAKLNTSRMETNLWLLFSFLFLEDLLASEVPPADDPLAGSFVRLCRLWSASGDLPMLFPGFSTSLENLDGSLMTPVEIYWFPVADIEYCFRCLLLAVNLSDPAKLFIAVRVLVCSFDPC